MSANLAHSLEGVGACPLRGPIIWPMKPSRKRTVLIAVLATLLLLSVGGVVAFNVVLGQVTSHIKVLPKANVATSNPLPNSFLSILNDSTPKEPLNVLLLGSDTRAGQGNGFGKVAGARSDTTMLVHINAARTDATVISFPRDLWVTVPECTDEQGVHHGSYTAKFNAAFAFGGANCTIALISHLSGIPVHHVVIVDFKGFQAIIDALGGLPVCLPEAVDDKEAHIQLPAGQQTLTGKQALGLARARHSLADGSDLQRINRQQSLVAHAFKYIKDKGVLTDPKTLYDLAPIAASALTVDPGLSGTYALAGLAWQMKNINPGHIHFFMVPYHGAGEAPDRTLTDVVAQQVFKDVLADLVPAAAQAKLSDPVATPPKTAGTGAKPSSSPSASATGSTSSTVSEMCADPLWQVGR